MSVSYLSLTNQRIRNALRYRDSVTLSSAIHLLLKEDQRKASQLIEWFSKVSNGIVMNGTIAEDLAILRMWLIGNVDIKEIENDGEPLFVLTYTGSEIVKRLPKAHHFQALLQNHMNDIAA